MAEAKMPSPANAVASRPHVLIVPLPGQGHVMPLMELAHRLVEHGIEMITFAACADSYARILDVLSKNGHTLPGIRLASFPYLALHEDDHKDPVKLHENRRSNQDLLEQLIRRINDEYSAGERSGGTTNVKWMVADESMWWAFPVAKKMGIRAAFFATTAAELIAQLRSATIKRTPLQQMDTANAAAKKHMMQVAIEVKQTVEAADIIICNTFHEAEPRTFEHFPDMWPVGPLLAQRDVDKPAGHLWQEDATCMSWLSTQATNSVIYAAFGSTTTFDHDQFKELVRGLELSGRPFLLMTKPFLTTGLNQEWVRAFRRRVQGRAMLVNWCPQQQVLAHPSIACFFSHCGWNSTLDGLSNGVPFLCWPHAGDQFDNQHCICNVWKTGLELGPPPAAVLMTGEAIKIGIEDLLADEDMKQNALWWRYDARRSISKEGSSYCNFKRFVHVLKEDE